MYIQRELEEEILDGANSFPVVTLTGPRQSGKTTLLKHLFPDKKYISLENPLDYEYALNDSNGFLNDNLDGLFSMKSNVSQICYPTFKGLLMTTINPGSLSYPAASNLI